MKHGALLAVFVGLISPVIAQQEPDARILKPSILLPLRGGIIIGAENGLFVARDGMPATPTGTELTVNEIVPGKDGYLIATDGGVFSFDPDKMSSPLVKIGSYSRSVRQIYGFAEDEYYLATQDGLKILSGDTIRSLGKNVEVDTLPCLFGGKIVGICGNDIVLSDSDHATFYDCGDVVTAVVPAVDQLFVATLSGLMALRGDRLEPVVVKTVVSDMVSVGQNLLMATPGGLLTMPIDGPYQPSKSREGFYSDLQPFDGGVLLAGRDRLDLLSPDLTQIATIPSPGARKSNKVRQEKGLLAFCLNNGLLVSADGGAKFDFTPSEQEVRDVISRNGRVMMATDSGISFLNDQPRPTPWLQIALGTGVVVLGSSFWRMRSRRRVIFISYRRSDSKEIACRLRDRLQGKFGSQSVRLDLHDIEEGEDFRVEIQRNVGEASMVLVLIGPHWAGATHADGSLRLFSEVDYVRYEIELAFQLKKPMVPVLLGNTGMPSANDLPETIRDLSFRQSMPLRSDPDFDGDLTDLIRVIRRPASKPPVS
ncbi:MAG: toll/interleukin-1 receptor domain-containing protein [Luteolibacter sp.]|uniref:toll/interleukin-1 receptor domain-containing protein n=1 Tax=Luteolibacter sp. TaxID=1962973 RepID=UPI0032645C96